MVRGTMVRVVLVAIAVAVAVVYMTGAHVATLQRAGRVIGAITGAL